MPLLSPPIAGGSGLVGTVGLVAWAGICLVFVSPKVVMFAQLQAQYPAASLLTDLVSVQDGLFVVKATIQIGDRPLVTSLAGARTVEAAEDQARSRAFALLPTNETTALSSPPPLPLTPLPFPPVTPLPDAPGAGQTVSPPTAPVATTTPETAAPPPPTSPAPSPNPGADVAPPPPGNAEPADWARHNLSSPPAGDPSEPDGAPITDTIPPGLSTAAQLPKAPARKPAPLTSPTAPTTPTAPPPPTTSPTTDPAVAAPSPVAPIIDRSEEIAQIDVEMRRLGWGRVEGREHLEKTYGKRSRQQLSDDELMEFLRYLQAQASPSTAPF